MKITKNNYFEQIKKIGFEKLPLVLKQSHTVIMTKTDNGDDWKLYNSDKDLKRMMDLAFQKLEEFMASKEGVSGVKSSENDIKAKAAALDMMGYFVSDGKSLKDILKMNTSFEEDGIKGKIKGGIILLENIKGNECSYRFEVKKLYPVFKSYSGGLGGQSKISNTAKEKVKEKKVQYKCEHKFIKLVLELDGKTITKKELDKIIEDLQVAITKKEITKQSPFKYYINFIQDELVRVYNTMTGSQTKIQLKESTSSELKHALHKTRDYIKSIHPKPLPEKQKSVSLKGVNVPDPIPTEVTPVKVEPAKMINSADFAKMNFETIGFTGKWLAFIGNPSPGFKVAVSSMPKMGKTFLCIDFANYLSQNHGKVLYVSKEEFGTATLQIKLKEKNVGNENLDVSGNILADLSPYKFIFLDSVSSLKLTADDLMKLEKANPGKSFIYVFQVTKAGKARGTNEFMHNVDIIIEVPEKGKALQYGRYNQGGEMNIFSENEKPILPEDSLHVQDNVSMLSGLKDKGKMESKKAKSEELFSKIKAAIKKLERVNAFIYKTKNPNWSDVASLCFIHADLGERLHDGYDGHKGYSKSLTEGLNRHYNANIKLLKELQIKMTEFLKKNLYPEMTDWLSFLEEQVERFGNEIKTIESLAAKRNEKKKGVTKSNDAMSIETDFEVPIQVLASQLFTRPMEEQILDKIKEAPQEVEDVAKGLAEDFIAENKSSVKVVSAKFIENDEEDIEQGISFFKVVLQGNETELREVTGPDSLLNYKW